jgi:hypothetical protein
MTHRDQTILWDIIHRSVLNPHNLPLRSTLFLLARQSKDQQRTVHLHLIPQWLELEPMFDIHVHLVESLITRSTRGRDIVGGFGGCFGWRRVNGG